GACRRDGESCRAAESVRGSPRSPAGRRPASCRGGARLSGHRRATAVHGDDRPQVGIARASLPSNADGGDPMRNDEEMMDVTTVLERLRDDLVAAIAA